jgi:chloramphenicol-sensitive protein RarD
LAINTKGLLSAVSAYILWGLFPIYWKWLHHVPAGQILAHRISWSFIFLVVILTAIKDWKWLRQGLKDRRTIILFFSAAVLLSMNWFIYIWAVNSGHVVESSLGYFINPLVYVILGVFFLHEHLRKDQWIAVGLAAIGVIYLTVLYGRLPWIALSLAVTFGVYGLLKKIGALSSLRGLTLETATMFLPALAFLIFEEIIGQAAFAHISPLTTFLLILAGPVTTIPLVLFGYGAQKIPLYMLGLAQYIAPTIQFFLGVIVYNEPFSPAQLVGFVLIWAALFVYSIGEYFAWNRRAMAASRQAG